MLLNKYQTCLMFCSRLAKYVSVYFVFLDIRTVLQMFERRQENKTKPIHLLYVQVFGKLL